MNKKIKSKLKICEKKCHNRFLVLNNWILNKYSEVKGAIKSNQTGPVTCLFEYYCLKSIQQHVSRRRLPFYVYLPLPPHLLFFVEFLVAATCRELQDGFKRDSHDPTRPIAIAFSCEGTGSHSESRPPGTFPFQAE